MLTTTGAWLAGVAVAAGAGCVGAAIAFVAGTAANTFCGRAKIGSF